VQRWLPRVSATVGRELGAHGRRFCGPGRGGALRSQDAWVQTCLARSVHLLDVPRLRSLWADLRDLPRGTDPDATTHGDLVPGNVLVAGGRLAGVLDVGGAGPADPARGRGWAFAQAIGLVWCYAECNPAVSAAGRRTLDRLTDAAEREPTSGVSRR
jgi:aminoglycoside phosphotransferase (APT) family kinase protein